MFLQATFSVLLLGWLCPLRVTGGKHSPPSCEDPRVEAFAAAFYTALIFSNDPIIFTLTITGEEASKLFYKVIFEDLIAAGVRGHNDAASIARIVARSVALVKWFTPVLYFKLKGYSVGRFLLDQQLLTCDNAVDLAFTYFNFVQPILNDLDDPNSMESYIKGISRGLLKFVLDLKLNNFLLSLQELARNFYYEFEKHASKV